mmetsp:Transcript_19254/g.55888  ORF Transcript_19254/g.55888 Transcript_19254/m.55888 type:complete len:220 (-) Transcript_19254:1391-2050(-)
MPDLRARALGELALALDGLRGAARPAHLRGPLHPRAGLAPQHLPPCAMGARPPAGFPLGPPDRAHGSRRLGCLRPGRRPDGSRGAPPARALRGQEDAALVPEPGVCRRGHLARTGNQPGICHGNSHDCVPSRLAALPAALHIQGQDIVFHEVRDRRAVAVQEPARHAIVRGWLREPQCPFRLQVPVAPLFHIPRPPRLYLDLHFHCSGRGVDPQAPRGD